MLNSDIWNISRHTFAEIRHRIQRTQSLVSANVSSCVSLSSLYFRCICHHFYSPQTILVHFFFFQDSMSIRQLHKSSSVSFLKKVSVLVFEDLEKLLVTISFSIYEENRQQRPLVAFWILRISFLLSLHCVSFAKQMSWARKTGAWTLVGKMMNICSVWKLSSTCGKSMIKNCSKCLVNEDSRHDSTSEAEAPEKQDFQHRMKRQEYWQEGMSIL